MTAETDDADRGDTDPAADGESESVNRGSHDRRSEHQSVADQGTEDRTPGNHDRGDHSDPDHRPERGDPPELRLDELTLPQRVFVAAVQNPFRGVLIALLFGFAFSFFIALWLAFPRFAAGFSVLTLAIVGVIVGVLAILR